MKIRIQIILLSMVLLSCLKAQLYYTQNTTARKVSNNWVLSDTNYKKNNEVIVPNTIIQGSGDKLISSFTLTTVDTANQSKEFVYTRLNSTSNVFGVHSSHGSTASRRHLGLKSMQVSSANTNSTIIMGIVLSVQEVHRALVFNCGLGNYSLYYESDSPLKSVSWSAGGTRVGDATLIKGIGRAYGSIITVTSLPASLNVTATYVSGDVLVIPVSGTTTPGNPVANAGLDQVASTPCLDYYAFNLNGTVGNAVGSTWSTAGSGTFSNKNDLKSIYYFSPEDIKRGYADLTLTTGFHPCSKIQSDVVRLSIPPPAGVSAGPDFTHCYTPGNVMQFSLAGSPKGSATGVLWSVVMGSGTLANPSISNTIYTPSVQDVADGRVVLRIASVGGNCGTTYDEVYIALKPQPTANAGVDQSSLVCQTSYTFSISGNTTLASGALWSTNGSGTFANSASLSTTYTLPEADIMKGTVELTLTTTGSECVASDKMLITVPIPARVSAGPDLSTCNATPIALQGSFFGSSTGSRWTILTGSGTLANVNSPTTIYTPSAADVTRGSVTLRNYSVGGNCPAKTDEMVIRIYPVPTLTLAGETNVQCGTPANITATSNINAAAISWYIDGQPVAIGTSNFTGIISGPTLLRATVSINGCSTSQDIVLKSTGSCNPTSCACSPYQAGNLSLSNICSPNIQELSGSNIAIDPGMIRKISNNFSGNINMSGGTLVVCGGTYSGTFNHTGGDIIIMPGTTFSLTSLNASGNHNIINYGTLNVNNINLGMRLENHGTVNANGTAASIINIASNGILFNDGNISIKGMSANTGNVTNFGTITSAGNYIMNIGSTLLNTCTLSVTTGTFQTAGLVTNRGKITQGFTTVFDAENDNLELCTECVTQTSTNGGTATATPRNSVSVSAGPDQTSVACLATYTFTMNSASGVNTGTYLWTTSGTGTFSNRAVLNATYKFSAADLLAGSVKLTLKGTGVVPYGPCSATDEIVLTVNRAGCACTTPALPAVNYAMKPTTCLVPANAVSLTSPIVGSYTFSASSYLVTDDLEFLDGTFNIPAGVVFYVRKKPTPIDPAGNPRTSIKFTNSNVIINGARFTACTDVWDGLTIDNDISSSLTVTNSEFANAQVAIRLMNPSSPFVIESNNFLNNISDCILLGSTATSSGSRITCNYFDSDWATMLSPYVGNGGYNTESGIRSSGGNYANMTLQKNVSNNILFAINNDNSGSFKTLSTPLDGNRNYWGHMCNGIRDLSIISGNINIENDWFVVKSERNATAQIQDVPGGGYMNTGIHFGMDVATVKKCTFTNSFQGYNATLMKTTTGRLRDMNAITTFGGTIDFSNNIIEGMDYGIMDFTGCNFGGCPPTNTVISLNSIRNNVTCYQKEMGSRANYAGGKNMQLSCNLFSNSTTGMQIGTGTGIPDQGSNGAGTGNVFSGITNQIVDLNTDNSNAWTYYSNNGTIGTSGTGSNYITLVIVTTSPSCAQYVPNAKIDEQILEHESGKLIASPNPFQESINLELNDEQGTVWSLKLIDLMGRVVYTNTLYNINQTLQLSDLASGMYTVLISSNTGQVFSKKVVKQ